MNHEKICLTDFNFTRDNDPEINKVILKQINEIKEQILKDVNDAVTISLLGGYGRGEGSVSKKGGKIIPLGDYDFFVITKYPHFKLNVKNLKSFENKFNIQYHVDVDTLWYELISLAGNRIYWYEFKFGSLLLYGDPAVINKIKINNVNEIDIKETFILIFNRLIGSIYKFEPSLLNQMSDEMEEHLIFQAVKLILACGEALLLYNGLYNESYYQRSIRIDEAINDYKEIDTSFLNDYKMASEFKLKPDKIKYNNPIDLWFNSIYHMKQMILYLSNKIFFNSKMDEFIINEDNFHELYLKNIKGTLLDYIIYNKNAILNKNLTGIVKINTPFSDVVRSSLFDFSLSIEKNGKINEKYLNRSINTITKIHNGSKEKILSLDLSERWIKVRDIITKYWVWARN